MVTAVYDGERWRPVSPQVETRAPVAGSDDPVLDGQMWLILNPGGTAVTGMLVSYGGVWLTVLP
jgi:hypothetical protein